MRLDRLAGKAFDIGRTQETMRTSSGAGEHAGGLCDEESFLRRICEERKRTDRSEKPFLLMLIDIRSSLGEEHAEIFLKEMEWALVSSKRETDACGWFKYGSTIGMLFTELEASETRNARETIAAKIVKILSERIPPEVMKKLSARFHFYPEKYDHVPGVNLFEESLYPDINHHETTRRKGDAAKRAIDLLGSGLALLLFSPLLIIISLLIATTSKGPILFRQERLGRFGKRFVFLKFRSMYVNTDDSIHREYIKKLITDNEPSEETGAGTHAPVYKIRNDPRVTPAGRFLRKTSLDELPQLLNVLAGDMSLVGPRPAIPYEFESYDIWHRYRLLQVKPGITGLWQITGRSSTSFDDMVRLDLQYIEEWSLWLDLKILFLTPWVVIKGRGAY